MEADGASALDETDEKSFDSAYCRKRVTAEDAIDLIPNGARIALGIGVSQPPSLLHAMTRKARSGTLKGIKLYYLLSSAVAGETVCAADLGDSIEPISLFHSGVERSLDKSAVAQGRSLCAIMPAAFSQVPKLLCEEVAVDTLIATVSPMDSSGNFSFGTNTDYAQPVSTIAKRVILEVNPRMPRVSGDCTVNIMDVTAIVEHDSPLLEYPRAAPSPEDNLIGSIIAGMVKDGDCLQMGIGALPDAVCRALLHHQHLGIHTELLTPGLANLMRMGVVDNSRKQIHSGKTVFTFAMGDKQLYEFMNDHPDLEAYPVSYVNNPFVIAQNENVLSVNATLQIDLNGACNSEFMHGRQFSGSGGQLDFVRGAYASKGGRSIIACHSTAAGGTVSRIAPVLSGPVTTPRNETHIVVTEYGWTNLKGKTCRERALALIGLAHPKFRGELAEAARSIALI
ncbi:4-hydroxybutyrate--acetyl-CoA CoA transferase (plasmid) [Sphingobium sp. SCG-1]|uniref:acetyl-CoA hydrolase/transferase family protein n=1 Tax=Sphingobium sp. SCG-1 TaxID=2072936 RepID=UPI000CD6AC93|nr:4-hydroxybutyrate--acetyl-CoA CoA transferase [Sphingobium sp. SCG-1]